MAITQYPELLEGLDAKQRAAVTSEAAPLAIQAGPGSGKTRVLTRRIAWRVATEQDEADKVLAVTFTRRAAHELSSRLRQLGVSSRNEGVTAGTLHAIALAQLQRRAGNNRRSFPQLLERKARLLFPLVLPHLTSDQEVGGRVEEFVQVSGVASDIEWAKARLIKPTDFSKEAVRLGRDTQLPPDKIEEIYGEYEKVKRTKKLVDFEDLLWWLGDALEGDKEFASEQRWRFRHLYVDEFQDVSAAQLRVVRGWLGERSGLTVVGDVDQAIFSFAGADPKGLTEFTRQFPGAEVLRLDHNYRSSPQIVATGEALLNDSYQTGSSPRPPRLASRPDGPWPTITEYENEVKEAQGIARQIREQLTPTNGWSSFAVLYRINSQSAAFEAAFAKQGIPVRLRGETRFLERAEVKAVLERLEQASERAPGADFSTLLADLSDDDGDDGDDGDDKTIDSGGETSINEHATEIVRLGHEYLAATDPSRRTGSVVGFKVWLATTLANEAPITGDDAVELLTFHRAKGLEFTTVFVTGLEKGLVPISHAKSEQEREEERRLLYVALTRAEDNLHFSWASQRSLGSRSAKRFPSVWLDPIAQARKSKNEAAKISDQKNGVKKSGPAQSRAHLVGPTASLNSELVNALSEWRKNRARAAAIPAYVVFPDTTLHALAQYQPKTSADLLDISGIGPTRVENYGDELLEIIGQHSAP